MDIKKNEGFTVPSMQSIWFGRQEKIFGTLEERKILVEYTKKAIDLIFENAKLKDAKAEKKDKEDK